VEEDVGSIAKTLAENYFDTDITSGFLDLVVQLYVGSLASGEQGLTDENSTVEQPLKIPFLAAIVLVLNPQKPEFTAEILRRLGDAAQKHIEAGNWREVKLFLRFLGCIQGLFEGNGVFALLEDLFSRAVDLQTASSEDVSRQMAS
jgi:nuclear cap-binding protein subunit 1